MIFAVLLTLALCGMGLYALAFMGERLLGKLLLVLYGAALFVVWQPDASTKIANFIGIGRGVDLGLMLISVISLNLIMFLIQHIHQLHRQVTVLTRTMAIRDALSAKTLAAADEHTLSGFGEAPESARRSALTASTATSDE